MHVVLTTVPTYQEDGWDCEAFLLLSTKTKKGTITYDTYMIDKRLVNDVYTRGKTTVTIPSLKPQASCLVDVYSYYKPAV